MGLNDTHGLSHAKGHSTDLSVRTPHEQHVIPYIVPWEI